LLACGVDVSRGAAYAGESELGKSFPSRGQRLASEGNGKDKKNLALGD
jgi:hypothetical protein